MSKAKPKKNPDERKRKIGSRIEEIERVITPSEHELEVETLIAALGEKQRAEDDKKAASVKFKAIIDTAKVQISESLDVITKKRRTDEVVVEEWLTAGNEIVRINSETGERIGGARNATAAEMEQEELDLETENDRLDRENDAPTVDDDPTPDNVVTPDFGGASSTAEH